MNFKQQIKLVLSLAAIMIVLEIINLFTGRWLNQFGLVPREVSHLSGILFSPWLHGGLGHLASNIVPFCVFSLLILRQGLRVYLLLSLWLILGTGLLVWLFARDAFHIGASGVIYGYFAYLLIAGFVSKQFKMLLISLFIGLMYGGLIWGIFPSVGFVSWESHLFGFICGAAATWKLASADKGQK